MDEWNKLYRKYLPKQKEPSLGGLEPPIFRLTAERANRLRHGDFLRMILYNFHQINFCGWNFNLCKISATLYHARKTRTVKTRKIWIVNILANETTHNRCYSTSSTEKGRLRPLSNDVQPRVACWSSGMILALVLEVPGSVPGQAFFNTLLSMKTTS